MTNARSRQALGVSWSDGRRSGSAGVGEVRWSSGRRHAVVDESMSSLAEKDGRAVAGLPKPVSITASGCFRSTVDP